MAAPTADLSIGSHKLTNVTDPTSAQDAATKNYVDSVAQGLDIKPSVLCATTANITLSGTQTIDTVAVVAGDRVLVKNQTTVNQNGIYVVAAGAWSRATDSDSWAKLPGAFTFVEKGSQADTGWASTVDAGGTLGVTDVTFVQFSGAGSITAGNGLSQSGTTISMRTPGTLTATSTNQANGTDHTHAIDATIARTSHTHTGMTTKYATTIVGTGAATTFDITHNLNTEDVITQVRLSANADPVAVYDFVEVDIQVRTVNMLRITFAVAPTNSEYYRVIVIG